MRGSFQVACLLAVLLFCALHRGVRQADAARVNECRLNTADPLNPVTPLPGLGLILDLAAYDFNNDNRTDVVLTTNSVLLNVYLANAPGPPPDLALSQSLTISTATSGSAATRTVRVVKLNNDTLMDLAVLASFPGTGAVNTFLALSPGVFSTSPIETTWSTLGCTGAVIYMGQTRFPGDIYDSIIGGHENICVLTGNGVGGWIKRANFGVSPNIFTSFTCADHDGDGDFDLVARTTYTLWMYRANSVHTSWVGPEAIYTTTLPPGQPHTLDHAIGDFNKDGVTDIVTGHLFSFHVLLGTNVSAAPFSAPVIYTKAAQYANLVIVADVDMDGNQDVVVSSFGAGQYAMQWFRGDGAGIFSLTGHTIMHSIYAPTPSANRAVRIGQVDDVQGSDFIYAEDPAVTFVPNVRRGVPAHIATCVQCFSLTCIANSFALESTVGAEVVLLPPGVYSGCLALPIIVAEKTMYMMPQSGAVTLNLTGCTASPLFLVSATYLTTMLKLINITIVGARGSLMHDVIRVVGAKAELALDGVAVVNGSSPRDGGFVSAVNGASVSILRSTFTGMSSGGNGGAVAVSGPTATLRVQSSLFRRNAAEAGGGAIALSGLVSMDALIEDSSFVDNTAAFGGAVAVLSEDLPSPSATIDTIAIPQTTASASARRLRLRGVSMTGNVAEHGGALLACGSLAIVNTSTIAANRAILAGAAIFLCSDDVAAGPPWSLNAATMGVPGNSPFFAPDAASLATILSSNVPTVAGEHLVAVMTPPAKVSFATLPPRTVPTSAPLGYGLVTRADRFGSETHDAGFAMAVGVDAMAAYTNREYIAIFSDAAVLDAVTLTPQSAAYVDQTLTLIVGLYMPVRNHIETDAGRLISPTLRVTAPITITGCQPGFGRGSSSPFTCIPCAAGLYSTNQTKEPCQTIPSCPARSARTQDNETAASVLAPCMCLAGAYSPSGQANVLCEPCPTGGECRGGLARPYAKPGYYDPSKGSGIGIAPCLRVGACAGGADQSSVCTKGYEGYFCRSCSTDYFTDTSRGGRCTKCAPAAVSLTAVGFALLIGGLMAAIILAICVANRMEFSAGEAAELDAAARRRVEASRRLPILPYSLNAGIIFCQTVGILSRSQIRWPSSVRTVMTVFNLANIDFDYFQLECTTKNGFAAKFVLIILVPALCGVTLGFVVLGLAAAKMLRGVVKAHHLALRIYCAATPLLYVPLALGTLQLFDCTKLPDGKFYLDADLGVQCYAGIWMVLLPFGLAGVLLYVLGIPLSLMLVLRRVRGRLGDPLVQMIAGSLYRFYRGSIMYFELVHLAKRLVFVVLMLFLARNQAWQILLLQILFFSFAAMHVARSPLYMPFLNTLEAVLHTCLSFICLFGYFFVHSDETSGIDYKSRLAFAFICLILIIGGAVAVFIAMLIESLWRRRILSPESDTDIRFAVFERYFAQDGGDWLDSDARAHIAEAIDHARPSDARKRDAPRTSDASAPSTPHDIELETVPSDEVRPLAVSMPAGAMAGKATAARGPAAAAPAPSAAASTAARPAAAPAESARTGTAKPTPPRNRRGNSVGPATTD